MNRIGEKQRIRIGAIAAALGFIFALITLLSGPGPVTGIPVLLVGAVVGWRLLPGFWTTLLAGVGGGAVAGLLVLGPGLRLAMRMVAIIDPVRTPEFTWAGTLGIIVVVGGISGVVFGVVAALLLRVAPRLVSVGVVVFGMMGMLLAPEDLRAEFVELGAGPWFNLPLFLAVVIAFAWVLVTLVRRLQPQKVEPRAAVEMQA